MWGRPPRQPAPGNPARRGLEPGAQVAYVDQGQAPAQRGRFQVGWAGHAAVRVHHLTAHPDRGQASPDARSAADTPVATVVEAVRDFLVGLTAAVGRDAAESASRAQEPFS